MVVDITQQCTEVCFVSFLSGGFTTTAVINPPERKLAKRISVQCEKLEMFFVFLLFQDSRNLSWSILSADPILDMEYRIEDAVAENVFNKAQKQERIAEEIKTVLKPHYTSKRIGKEDYKNILRKCVPKLR